MTYPTVDIIVPVWNFPFETRACLRALLMHSPEARLIVVDSGSSRETELMLEEFSESLGERGLFLKTDRNVGLVPAINLGLARSDSDFAVVVRPHVQVKANWLTLLLAAAETDGAGIVSPYFTGEGAPHLPHPVPGCTAMETCTVSLTTLLLRGEMLIIAGLFNENLDSGEWCLKEYVRRVADKGYRTCITNLTLMTCGAEPFFGTAEGRTETVMSYRSSFLERWGAPQHYCVYFGKDADSNSLNEAVETIIESARIGHRFTILLHHRQHRDFCKRGWNALHTGVDLICLSFLFPLRDLEQKLAGLFSDDSAIIVLRGTKSAHFPGVNPAVVPSDLLENICMRSPVPAVLYEEAAS